MTSEQNDDLAPEVRDALRKEAKEENAFGDPQRLLDAFRQLGVKNWPGLREVLLEPGVHPSPELLQTLLDEVGMVDEVEMNHNRLYTLPVKRTKP